jgi:exodeoxyribonuclease V alpha subunit
VNAAISVLGWDELRDSRPDLRWTSVDEEVVSLVEMEHDLARLFATRVRPNPHFLGWDSACAIGAAAAPLNDSQRRALFAAAEHNLVLVSGGAGSGKTFTLAAIAEMYEERGLEVVLAAPTGKAARRMEQVAGREAKTLHRLLGFDGRSFRSTPKSPLHADLIIIDEVSMLDVPLAWRLFRAIDLGKTSVVLVGDHNQLPPVGPGHFLRDLIERRPIPMVLLDEVVRQAGVLLESSMAILRGEVRPTAARDAHGRRPWIVLDQLGDADKAQRAVLALFDSIGEHFTFDLLTEVQLLTPTRRGPLGTDALNPLLQRLVQKKRWGVEAPPRSRGQRPMILRHDRVMQTRNNYALGVMNGAIGIVTEVRAHGICVRFEDQDIEYTTEESQRELSLAYALTVHKAQGSEFPCVVLVVHSAHAFLHHRNLFYTGVTRAREVAIVVGDPLGVRTCAETPISVSTLTPRFVRENCSRSTNPW